LLIYTVVVLLYISIVKISDYSVICMVLGHVMMIPMIFGQHMTNYMILATDKKIRK